MNLPADIADAVVKAAAVVIADRMSSTFEDFQMFTIGQVAAALKVSEPTARRLIRDHIDLGEASKRISVTQFRALVASRTVNA